MTKVARSFKIDSEKAELVEKYFYEKFPNENLNSNKIYGMIVENFLEDYVQNGKRFSDNSDFGFLKKQIATLKKQGDIATYISLEMLKLVKHDPKNYRSIRMDGTKENEIYSRILSIVNNDIEVSKKIKDSQIV